MKQEQKQRPLLVFFSYAQADWIWQEQLTKHLSQLKRSGLIEGWSHQQILPGDDRARKIDQALYSAHIILLLISADFLASDVQYQSEMQHALERHRRGDAHVVPIIVRPCDWQHSSFAHLQCLPRTGKPISTWDHQDEAFLAITQELRRIIAHQQFPSSLSEAQRQNRARFLKRVRTIWIEGLLEHSLHQAAWIELHLQDQPDALINPWRLQVQELDQEPRVLPAGASMVQMYDEADGELLILGEPGAGKTTLLLHLARTLLDRAEADERVSMPAVFNLSSWAQRRQSLATWLSDELQTKYQVPRRTAEQWVERRQVLPLLDGLDEMAEEARVACVQAITAYYSRDLIRIGTPLVVCCRSQEYRELSLHLPLSRAVSILPLTKEQIDAYFSSAQGQLEGLRQALHNDEELAALARRPLMLSIFTLAYQEAPAQDFPPPSSSQEQTLHAVFSSYVKCMLCRRGALPPWMHEQFLHWLTFIAKQLQRYQQTVLQVEDLQPDWLPDSQQQLYRWSIILGYGVFFALLGFLSYGLIFLLGYGLYYGLVFGGLGSLFGLVFGTGAQLFAMGSTLVSELYRRMFDGPLGRRDIGKMVQQTALGFSEAYKDTAHRLSGAYDSRRVPPPAEMINWSWKAIHEELIFVLIFGLLAGLVFGLLFGLTFGLTSALLTWSSCALCLGLVSGLSTSQLNEQAYLSPNEGIHRSKRNGLLVGLFFGPLLGLLVGLGAGLLFPIGTQEFRLGVGLFFGFGAGLFLGLGISLGHGLNAFMQHFVLRFFLWRLNILPWDLIPFLNKATEHLLLRKVGGSYIFVHRLLLEYFASLEEKQES